MTNKTLIAICISSMSLISGIAYANTSGSHCITSGYSKPVGGNELDPNLYTLESLKSYGKTATKLYIRNEDCDDNTDNDVNLSLEANPCLSGDKTFLEAMRDSHIANPLKVSTGNIDSTVLENYGVIATRFTKNAQDNNSGFFCEKSNDYNGRKNNQAFCDTKSNIKIDSVIYPDGIPSDQNECYVDLDRNLRAGETMVLSVKKYSPSGTGEEGYYTLGYATVSCSLDPSNGYKATVKVEKNDPTKCDLTRTDYYDKDCKQICVWGKSLHCPEKVVNWGLDNKCSYKMGVGYLGDNVTVESQNPYYNGSAYFKCDFGGNWVMVGSGATCSLNSGNNIR